MKQPCRLFWPGHVDVVPATAHAAGGCLGVVRMLADRGVRAVVAIGMGRRPLEGLLQAGTARCVFVLVGTVWQVPPVSYVSQLRSEVRGGHQSEPLHFAGGRRGWRHVE